MGFLQDTDAWIFMPRSVTLLVSEDGTTFRHVNGGKVVVPEGTPPTRKDMIFDLSPVVRTRYVRIHVERYGKLPAWHPGASNEAWFFADEIVIQ
jgi:hexosaminidase